MAQAVPGIHMTLMAGANLTGKRFRALRQSAERTCVIAGAAAEDVVGVLQDEPNAAGIGLNYAPIGGGGSTVVSAGAAFAAGAKLTPDVNGQWVTATTGQPFYCEAIQAATALNDEVEALLNGRGRIP